VRLEVVEGGFKSGKTEFLINKFLELLNKGVSLNEILFIHPQPELIKEKIKKNLKRGYSEIHIDTVTGFCKWFLRKYQDKLSFPGPGFRVISGLEERLIVKKIISGYPKWKNFISSISSFIDLYKLNFYPLPPKIEEKYTDLMEIFKDYQRFLKSRNWLDLRDLVIYSIMFIEKNMHIIEDMGFKYIFVDEAENLDYNSFVLVEKFFKKAEEVYISVNKNGSIYLFRGCLGKKVLSFLKKYEKKEVKLSNEKNQIQIEYSAHMDEYLEVLYVLRNIRKLLRKGISPSNIAILVRDFDIRVKILEDLSKVFSIPLEVKAGVSIFKEPILIQFISFLSLINKENLNNPNRVLKAISTPNFWDEEYNIFYIKAENKKISFYDFLKEKKDEKIKKFFNVLENLRKIKDHRKIIDVVYLAYKETGFEEISLKDLSISRIFSFFFDIVERFSEIFPEANVDEFIIQIEDIMEFYGRENYLEELNNTIRVLTVHEAGGDKFDYVFLMGVNDGNFPRDYRLDTFPYFDSEERKRFKIEPEYSLKEHIEEEKRIFYKAISRGIRKVFISCVENKSDIPSPFLEELDLRSKNEHPKVFLPDKVEEILDFNEYDYFYSVNFKEPEYKEIVDKFYIKDDFKFTYSNLDRYKRCPMKFFFSEILKIRFPSEWAQERGTIIHNVLMNLHRKYRKGSFPLDIEEEVRNMVKEEFDKIGHLVLWERRHQENIVLRELLDYVNEYKNFDVVEVEKKVEFKYKDFNFSLKVDRIDKLNSGYKIIDYKTGKPWGKTISTFRNRFNGKKKDHDVQFSLYYTGLKEFYFLPVEEFEIIFLKEKLLVFNLKVDEIRKYISERFKEIINLCREIKNGNFYFDKKDNCYMCKYKSVCLYKKEKFIIK